MSACLLDSQTTNRNNARKISEYYIGMSTSKSICHEHAVSGDETHRTAKIANEIPINGITTNL